MKPCVKCGSTVRYKNGSCAACAATYRKKIADKKIAYQREYVKLHYEQKRAYDIEYANKNKEKIAEYKKEWEAKNRDCVNAKSRDWRKNNPEKAFLIAQRYRKNNPEARSLLAHNRRTKIKGDKPSVDIVQKLMEKQKGLCVCCAQPLVEYHLDHIMPLALGGRHIDENLQLLTPRCNRRKSDKHPDVWRAELTASLPEGVLSFWVCKP